MVQTPTTAVCWPWTMTTTTGCSTLNTTVSPASESTKILHTEHRLASTMPITTMLDGVPTHQLVSVSLEFLIVEAVKSLSIICSNYRSITLTTIFRLQCRQRLQSICSSYPDRRRGRSDSTPEQPISWRWFGCYRECCKFIWLKIDQWLKIHSD